jgi:acyl-CoA reductase-like NAD-dependent aldehyde dehydrogenase
LIVEEDGVGPDHPFSGEKLSVVLALYRYEGGIENAVRLVNAITHYQGRGHTCGVHTRSEEHVMALAHGTKTGRVLVNQNLNEGAGSPRNGLPYTLSLNCGGTATRALQAGRRTCYIQEAYDLKGADNLVDCGAAKSTSGDMQEIGDLRQGIESQPLTLRRLIA